MHLWILNRGLLNPHRKINFAPMCTILTYERFCDCYFSFFFRNTNCKTKFCHYDYKLLFWWGGENHEIYIELEFVSVVKNYLAFFSIYGSVMIGKWNTLHHFKFYIIMRQLEIVWPTTLRIKCKSIYATLVRTQKNILFMIATKCLFLQL